MRSPVAPMLPPQHAVRVAAPCMQPEAPPLPRRLARLAAAVGAPSDRRERLVRLVRVGNRLPHASAALVVADGTRVSGCTSVVDVLARLAANGTLQPEGAADSRLAKGLVALLVRGLRGESPDALASLDVAAISEAAGLSGALSHSRINGLGAMLDLMREQAAAAVARRQLSPDRPVGAAGPPAPLPPALALPADNLLLAARRGSWQAAGEEVAVLLSGGVDSSVALRLLHDAGVRTRAFYLRIWLEDEDSHVARGECPWEEDWGYCSAVCEQAGVPLERVSLQTEYSRLVVDYMIAEARAGRTPNPDMMCNSRIKFGAFMDSVGHQFSCVASGHYARSALQGEEGYQHSDGGSDSRLWPAMPVAAGGGGGGSRARWVAPSSPARRGGEVLAATSSSSRAPDAEFRQSPQPQALLYCSEDEHKDQTYFLSQLSQSQLRQAVFPLGGMPKPHVRQLADRLRLPNRARKDSQGICFLGQLDYDQFLRGHLEESQGEVREFETGQLIGTHRGLWHHTVGQRRGVGPILHPRQVSRGPWYVVRKDTAANQLIVSREYQSTDKARNNFYADSINWIAGAPPAAGGTAGTPLELRVKVRHGAAWHAAHVTLLDGGRRAHVQLEQRDKGLAPGQFAALYDGAVCLGSGVISEEGLYW